MAIERFMCDKIMRPFGTGPVRLILLCYPMAFRYARLPMPWIQYARSTSRTPNFDTRAEAVNRVEY